MDKEKMAEKYKAFTGLLKNNNMTVIFVVALIGILFLLFGSSFSSSKTKQTETAPVIAGERIENKDIEKLILHIPGVSKAYVMISYEDNGKKEYAYDYKGDVSKKDAGDTQSNSDNKMVITRQSGDEKPVVVREISPGIKGVTVIVQGTDDIELKYKIYNAVKSALGVEPHKIEVILN